MKSGFHPATLERQGIIQGNKVYSLFLTVAVIDLLFVSTDVLLAVLPRNNVTHALVQSFSISFVGIIGVYALIPFAYWLVKGPILLFFTFMMDRAPTSRQAKWQHRAIRILFGNLLLGMLAIVGIVAGREWWRLQWLSIVHVIVATLPSAWALWRLYGREDGRVLAHGRP